MFAHLINRKFIGFFQYNTKKKCTTLTTIHITVLHCTEPAQNVYACCMRGERNSVKFASPVDSEPKSFDSDQLDFIALNKVEQGKYRHNELVDIITYNLLSH